MTNKSTTTSDRDLSGVDNRPQQKYYRVEHDMQGRRWYLKGPVMPDGRAIDPRLFTEGKPLDLVGPLFIPLRRSGPALDVTLADFDMPVFRRPFADALEEIAPNQIQRFRAVVEGHDDAFDIVNVLPVVSCLDEKRSGVTYWSEVDGRPEKVGQYRMVIDPKVDRRRIGSEEIFRIAGWKIMLVVSDRVKHLLTNASGVALIQV